jgi:hypothetical protein
VLKDWSAQFVLGLVGVATLALAGRAASTWGGEESEPHLIRLEASFDELVPPEASIEKIADPGGPLAQAAKQRTN